jgi:hypothetical protein
MLNIRIRENSSASQYKSHTIRMKSFSGTPCSEQSPPSYNRAVHIQLKAGKSSNFGRTSRDRNSSFAIAKGAMSDSSVDFGEANLGLRTSPAMGGKPCQAALR